MNAARRKELKAIVSKLEALDALREEIWDDLRQVANDEQDALENMPESLQESERGQTMQEYIDTMDEVMDELENIDLQELMDQLQEIVEG